MLLRFHIVLVATGTVFCFGYALYECFRERSGLLIGFFVAGGIAMALYLRRVLRYGLKARR